MVELVLWYFGSGVSAVTGSLSGPRKLFKGVIPATSGVLARFPWLFPVRNSFASYGASAVARTSDRGHVAEAILCVLVILTLVYYKVRRSGELTSVWESVPFIKFIKKITPRAPTSVPFI
jgi:hypothetical protein